DLSAVGQEITRRLFGDGAAKPEPVQLPPSRVYAQEGAAPNADGHEDAAETLAGLVAVSGVSGHEQGVFATLRFLLARHLQGQGMARDDAGNLVVTIGKGKRTVVFVAHMDEVGFVITKLRDDGFCEVRRRGGFYPHLYTWTAMDVVTKRGVRPAISIEADGRTLVDLGVRSKAALEAMGIAVGQPATVPKEFLRLGPHRATGRSFDDRVGCAALVMALKKLDRDKLDRRVVFAWVTREEIGLEGADHLAKTLRPKPDVVFPVDTFVSSDSPRDDPRFAFARIGGGPVLRAWDNSSITSPLVLDRVRALADGIPLQVGMVGGGNDGSRFVPHGVVNCPLAWPQRCSHSRVETMDLRDLEALADLVARIAVGY
ncbi:MAG: hypothetical protein CMJ83_02400, partial [Planctomycetes bacterium]|nr:hypothetical protein [Planctomycetota bacterium]